MNYNWNKVEQRKNYELHYFFKIRATICICVYNTYQDEYDPTRAENMIYSSEANVWGDFLLIPSVYIISLLFCTRISNLNWLWKSSNTMRYNIHENNSDINKLDIQVNEMWRSNNITTATKVKLYGTFVIPAIMSECWCFRKEDERRILVAEMSWL